eukprot:gene1570-10207_t
MATGDAAGSGQGATSKIDKRRERQFREFMEFEAMYAKMAMETGGKGLRELQAMKQTGMKFLKERHADDNHLDKYNPLHNTSMSLCSTCMSPFNGQSMKLLPFNNQHSKKPKFPSPGK